MNVTWKLLFSAVEFKLKNKIKSPLNNCLGVITFPGYSLLLRERGGNLHRS